MLVAAAALMPAQNTLSRKEIDEGWILLFDGESTFGWVPMGQAEWRVENGALVSSEGGYGWLRTGSEFADYVLKAQFRCSEKCNSGIFLRSALEGEPHKTGYELQMFDSHPKFPTGSFVDHVATGKKHKLRANEWNQYEITANGNRYQIVLNGKKVLDTVQDKTRIGFIGLQHNKDLKIEFRDIKLKPLGGAPVFDGKSLAGWHEVKTPRAKEPPVWSAKGGMIHVEKGPGQLETDGVYDDLVLQLAIRANARDANHHPNSGVFLRGEPNSFWTGYETQIRNEFKDGDRTKPVDFGTGGVYFYQPARKVVSSDNVFFVKTVVAKGRHFGVWIDGYPVSDWQDPHPEGNSVRDKQARLGAGAISLQAHDPTTNLDFKNIRVARLPRQGAK